jgi:hypothetical protein
MKNQDWIITTPHARRLDFPKTPVQRPPNLLPIFDEGRYAYQLAEDWTVGTSLGSFSLPKGMILDGASVPRLFWNIYPPDGLFRAGTTLHDFMYCQQGQICLCCKPNTRKEADTLLLELCRLYNAPGPGLMYRMVRMFGGLAWKNAGALRVEPLRYEIS